MQKPNNVKSTDVHSPAMLEDWLAFEDWDYVRRVISQAQDNSTLSSVRQMIAEQAVNAVADTRHVVRLKKQL